MEKLSSGQLYSLWQERIQEEKQEDVLRNNSALTELKVFLTGKTYLKETCLNSAVTYYYECDPSHEPKTKDDKWVNVKNLLTIRIVHQQDRTINSPQCSIELTHLEDTS